MPFPPPGGSRADGCLANVCSVIIAEHNAKGLSYTLGHNEYTDLTWDEFAAERLPGVLPSPIFREPRPTFVPPIEDPPTAIDWVAKGGVTPIKNQGAHRNLSMTAHIGARARPHVTPDKLA